MAHTFFLEKKTDQTHGFRYHYLVMFGDVSFQFINSKNGNNKGFWSEVSRTELLTKSACSREDSESGSCLQSRDLIDICPIDTDPNCDKHLNSKTIYRSFDGSCTNLEEGQRWWGMAPSAQVRVLPSQYENGECKIVKTVSAQIGKCECKNKANL